MAWTGLTYPFGSKLTSAKMTQNQDNFAAMANGDSGAPSIQQAAMGAAAIGQNECKTTTGEVSTITLATLTLPGGQYGFWPETRVSAGSGSAQVASALNATSYAARISMSCSGGTIYAQQRYFQASPPYNLGEGEIPLFVFCEINKSSGIIESIYSAPEAPWHYNGPTKISAEYYVDGKPYKKIQIIDPKKFDTDELIIQEIEITQEIKNADIAIIPHPFSNINLTTHDVILIDPISDMMWKMKEAFEDNLSELHDLLYNGYLIVDNNPLNRIAPVNCHMVKWK